jgi:hypothetical protein
VQILKQTLIFISYCCLLQWSNISVSESHTNYWQLPIPLQGSISKAYDNQVFGIESEKCGICHLKIYNQWQSSFHARASSPGLLGQLPAFDDDVRKDCLNCHAPRTEQQQSLNADYSKQIHGIDCASCHLREHSYYGPKINSLSPHGEVKQLNLFKQSEFCASCHQFTGDGILVNGKPLENTFVEWKTSRYAKEGIECQNCHMKDGHSFKGIHDKTITQEGLSVKVNRNANRIELQATNTGAGHALPTYITPRIRIKIFTLDGKKKVEYIIQRSMQWSIKNGWQELFDTRLLPDQSIVLDLPLTSEVHAKVEVIVEPDADYHERVYPQLISQLAEDLPPRAMEQLNSAKVCSGDSIYVLYSYDCQANTNSCVEN